jgi:hypothetical protein
VTDRIDLINSARAELAELRSALANQSAACEVAVPTGRRLVVVRGPMPVADVVAASVRFLRAVAVVAAEDARDTLSALDAERFGVFAAHVWDWATELFEKDLEELDQADLESARRLIGARRPDEIAAELTDPRAVAALTADAAGPRAERAPAQPASTPWLAELAAARWLAGKTAEKSAEQYPADPDTARRLAERLGLGRVPNPADFSAAQVAFARSQRFRAALRRAGVSLAEFEAAHRAASQELGDVADAVFWELDALVESAVELADRERRERGEAPY